jgi:hypothetical protein
MAADVSLGLLGKVKRIPFSKNEDCADTVYKVNKTVQLFGTEGQKFFACPGTKGQRNKLKILPWDGTGF